MSTGSPESSVSATRVIPWLKSEWHQPLTTAGAVLALATGRADGWLGWTLFGVSVLATLVGAVVGYRRRTDTKALKKDLRDERKSHADRRERLGEVEKKLQSVRDLGAELLYAILTMVRDELELSDFERITIYAHDADLGSFQKLQRSAANPHLAMAGRAVYADNVGVIGDAWRVSEGVVENDLPEWSGDGLDYLADNLKRFALPEEVCRNLSMKSRSLIGLRFPLDGTGGRRPVGVVVLESLDPTWATDDRLNQLKKSKSWKVLDDYMHSQRNDLPLLGGAAGKGF